MTTTTIEYSIHKRGSYWLITQHTGGLNIGERCKSKRDALAKMDKWKDYWLKDDKQVSVTIYDAKGNFQSQELAAVCKGE